MGGRVWTLTQTDDSLWYHVYKNQDNHGEECDRKRKAGVGFQVENKPEKRSRVAVKEEEEEKPMVVALGQDTEEEEETLRDYFQLNVKLVDLYREWGAADPHFRRIADIFTGVHAWSLLLHIRRWLSHHCLKNPYHLVSPQVCECCARTLLNACFPSFVPPTTTSLASRAWWRGCARLWALRCANWIRPHTTTFHPCPRLQVLYDFPTDLFLLFITFQEHCISGAGVHNWVRTFYYIVCSFIFAFGSVVQNPTRRSWFVSWAMQQYFQLQALSVLFISSLQVLRY